MVAIGWMVHQTLAACEELAKEGLSIEVIDPRTVSPLDIDTILASVHKTGRLLVVDEDYSPCGVGGGDRRAGGGAGFRRSGRAGDAAERRLRPSSLQPAAGGGDGAHLGSIAQAIRDLLAE